MAAAVWAVAFSAAISLAGLSGTAQAADELSCRAALAGRGVKAAPLPAIADGDCGAPVPLRLTAVRGAAVRLPATTTCAMADALDRWAAEAVAPEAKRILGKSLQAIQVGTSYQCRTRNRVPGGRLSEHAFANALDLHGFVMEDGVEVPVRPAGSAKTAEARFVAAVRRRACAYFTTVLGPGSDAAHADHLHLDLRQRKRGYRICQ